MNCQDWGYDSHPLRAGLGARCSELTKRLTKSASRYMRRFGYDTRIAHWYLFSPLAPVACQCIIGRYRGDPSCAELLKCRVWAGGDPRVGVDPHFVASKMREFERNCQTLYQRHQRWLAGPGKSEPPRKALLKYVEILAIMIEKFLTIHPYMDGNGHSARLLTVAMMSAGGYPPTAWDIDQKQPYDSALSEHRNGKPTELQKFLLNVIAGAAAPPPATLTH